MVWTFRILVTFNALLLALALFYQSPGEDPAGTSMRAGIAVVYAVVLAIVLLLYRIIKTPWVRVPLLVVLVLPVLLVFHGFALSF